MVTDQENPSEAPAIDCVEPSENRKASVDLMLPVTSKVEEGLVVPIPTRPFSKIPA